MPKATAVVWSVRGGEEGEGKRTLLAVHLGVQGVVVDRGDGVVDLEEDQKGDLSEEVYMLLTACAAARPPDSKPKPERRVFASTTASNAGVTA